jgi:hypothetical protein
MHIRSARQKRASGLDFALAFLGMGYDPLQCDIPVSGAGLPPDDTGDTNDQG